MPAASGHIGVAIAFQAGWTGGAITVLFSFMSPVEPVIGVPLTV